ncbi:VMAP-C domain-containing protein [Streptomyces cyaneofuscatus]|uniref:VMAP-C domain-containing protein n=1 Tax=Streptomyces cyaneofuscatus TaxID=66883 RepID=UPI0037D3D9F8
MDWFTAPGPSGSADPQRFVVSLLRADDGRTAGAGVMLAAGHLLTCAHVVNDALGRHMFTTGRPARGTVMVVVHGANSTRRYAGRVAHWVAPRRLDGQGPVREDRDQEWLGDLAVLRLEVPGSEQVAVPERRRMAEGQSLRAWHATNLRSSFADVRVKTCDDVIGYVDGEPMGMPIGPAYSGGPVWWGAERAVVGIVAAHIMPPADPATGRPYAFSSQDIARRSWCIPWQRVEDELRAAGAGHLIDPLPAATDDDPAVELLTDLVEAALPSPVLRADTGRAVAERFGLAAPRDGSAPTPGEFARLLVGEPRAIAALTEVLRQDPDVVAHLLTVGPLSPTYRFLSPREYRKLHTLLDALPEQLLDRLPEMVRAALPLAASLPVDPGSAGVDALLDALECLQGDSRASADGQDVRVPALLRVVEYVAVLGSSAQRADLRLWNDGVAARLGIPRSALGERRSDAGEWAAAVASTGGPARLLAHVVRADGDRFRLRIWCDEGAGPRQVPSDGGATYSGTEAAGELLRVLESLYRNDHEGRRPLVEVLVDRAGLNLPIDEWECFGPDGVVPGVLGAEYPVVVNCPELLRRNERFLPDWRRRWRQLDTGTSLRFDDAAAQPREVYGTLLDRLDAVRVSVDVPPRPRDEIVQVCLAMGVPVVVWDRSGSGGSAAVEHISRVATRRLPEGVRSYRAKSVHGPEQFPGRPVLAWADADRTVPQLQLSEPQETR